MEVSKLVDKTKSIKELEDFELEELLIRLRREREAQEIIASIARNSLERNPYSPSNELWPGISTEAPINTLYHSKVEEVLSHYGVLGMKWGVRRPVGPDGLVLGGKKAKQLPSEDYLRVKELRKLKVKQLSNKDIKEINTRLQLEKTSRELKTADMSKEMDTVKNILAVAASAGAIAASVKTIRDNVMLAKDWFEQKQQIKELASSISEDAITRWASKAIS